MDKNPNGVELTDIFNNQVNSILYYNAFTKESIIQKIVQAYSLPIIYLDFDLLYTGYINSGIIEKKENVTILNPKEENWNKLLKKILTRISNDDCILIIDSLNGFFSIFDEKDSGRYANSCMMILSSFIQSTKSKIFLNSIARLKENEGWRLYPTGRQVLENKSISKFFVNENKEIEILSVDNRTNQIIKI